MKTIIRKLMLVGVFPTLALLSSAQQSQNTASVEVNYEQPEEFTDFQRTFGPGQGADEAYMQELKEHLQEQARSQLQPGQTLQVTITDVDMAGDFEPQRGARFNDVRIVKDVYPPRIELRFQLADASGNVISEGKRELSDLAFSSNLQPVRRDDPLRHEKQLIDDFLRDIAKRTAQRQSE